MIGNLLLFYFKQSGGAKTTTSTSKFNISTLFLLFIIWIVALLIDALIVEYTYNTVMPKIYRSIQPDNSMFIRITIIDAIILIILISALFKTNF